MPKVHELGSHYFVQLLDNYIVEWGARIAVRGWTQEIEEPFRVAAPLIVRLPRNKAIVFGRWNGTRSEEDALSTAIQKRDLTDDDFQEEKGWIAVPNQNSEEGFDHFHFGTHYLD